MSARAATAAEWTDAAGGLGCYCDRSEPDRCIGAPYAEPCTCDCHYVDEPESGEASDQQELVPSCACGGSRPPEVLTADLLTAGERCACVDSGVHTACVGHCGESSARARARVGESGEGAPGRRAVADVDGKDRPCSDLDCFSCPGDRTPSGEGSPSR